MTVLTENKVVSPYSGTLFLTIIVCINVFFNTGGSYLDTTASILKFDPRSLSWSEVGEMAQARFMHGASVVSAEHVGQYCVYK